MPFSKPTRTVLSHAPTPSSSPKALVDANKRIFGVLAGRQVTKPNQPDDWDRVVAEVNLAIHKVHQELQLCDSDCDHRRGPQAARAFGVSMGNGQVVCYPHDYLRAPTNQCASTRVFAGRPTHITSA